MTNKLASLGLSLSLLSLVPATQAQSLPARVHHAQAALPDGRVMITGGERYDALVAWGAGSSRALSRDTWIFDPASGQWTSGGRLVRPRTNHSEVALPDGRVVVLGGGAREDAPDPTVESKVRHATMPTTAMSMRRITYSTVERPSVLRRSERVLVFMVASSFRGLVAILSARRPQGKGIARMIWANR